MTYAPIALFVYNRPDHVRRAIASIARNEEAKLSDLFVFSDGPKNSAAVGPVQEVRECLRSITGFRSVHVEEQQQNLGLARSIIAGVSKIVQEFGKIIVIEDDLETSPYFLRFMNDGLSVYADDLNVASIHGYMYPVEEELPDTFFLRGADCWGWATWERAWGNFQADGALLLERLHQEGLERKFNLYGARPLVRMLRDQTRGLNNSWAIRWHASAFLEEMYTLYPAHSLIRNIGMDGSGTHCHADGSFDSVATAVPVLFKRMPVFECIRARRAVQKFFYKSRMRSAIRKVKVGIQRRVRVIGQ